MTRKAAEANDVANRILEYISNVEDGSIAPDELLAALAHLRESGTENAAVIERMLMEIIEHQRAGLFSLQEDHEKLRELIKTLTAPPYFPAVFLATTNTPQIQGALVQTDTDRRVVQVGEGVTLDQLTPGDEVFLSHERNYLITKSDGQSFLTGEVATYSRSIGDGRLVLRARDEELVVLPTAALRAAGLKAGEGVRFGRSMGLAFERIEPSKGEEYFLEATPNDSFDEVGGLDREIETLKRVLTLHMFHEGTAGKYKLRRKEGGPDGGSAGQWQDQGGARHLRLAGKLVAERALPFHQRETGRPQQHVVRRHRTAVSRDLPRRAGSGGGGTGCSGGHVLG